MEELQQRIKELEDELQAVRSAGSSYRKKIDQMSAEVVDSNPYRFVYTVNVRWYYYTIYH